MMMRTANDAASRAVDGATMRVLLRVDASPSIGLGHAMRCLALVQVLRAAGHAVRVATLAMPESLRRQYTGLGVIVHDLTDDLALSGDQAGSEQDAMATAQAARAHDAHWVLADGYAFTFPWQKVVRRSAHLALFDDEAVADRWDADLLINQNLGATRAAYGKRAGEATLLVGAGYVLLREEFRVMSRAPREVPHAARRLLITLGGADPENVTTQVLRALTTLSDLEVRVVVGAANVHKASVDAAVRELPASIAAEVLTHVTDMPQHMQWADMALSAGGSTLWELAYMQLPALAVVLADNQRGGVSACVAAGTIRSLGDAADVHLRDIALAISELRNDKPLRERMTSAGASLVDGRGANRVMHALEQALRPETVAS